MRISDWSSDVCSSDLLSMKHGATTAFADDLGQSFERFGFAMICDHGLDPALGERGWALAKALFAQPEEVKRAYHVPGGGGQRGYTPLGTEIARDATENDLEDRTSTRLNSSHQCEYRMPSYA